MFRVWATRLFGALTAKLVYSLLLRATLLLTNLLAGLASAGGRNGRRPPAAADPAPRA